MCQVVNKQIVETSLLTRSVDCIRKRALYCMNCSKTEQRRGVEHPPQSRATRDPGYSAYSTSRGRMRCMYVCTKTITMRSLRGAYSLSGLKRSVAGPSRVAGMFGCYPLSFSVHGDDAPMDVCMARISLFQNKGMEMISTSRLPAYPPRLARKATMGYLETGTMNRAMKTHHRDIKLSNDYCAVLPRVAKIG